MTALILSRPFSRALDTAAYLVSRFHPLSHPGSLPPAELPKPNRRSPTLRRPSSSTTRPRPRPALPAAHPQQQLYGWLRSDTRRSRVTVRRGAGNCDTRRVGGVSIRRREDRKRWDGTEGEATLKEVRENTPVRWMAPRSRRGNAKRRDGSLKVGAGDWLMKNNVLSSRRLFHGTGRVTARICSES
jgi:hypothetical protein